MLMYLYMFTFQIHLHPINLIYTCVFKHDFNVEQTQLLEGVNNKLVAK